MLKKFYANYSAATLISCAVMICGIIQFMRLPVALYPMTSKPRITARLHIPDMAPQEFFERYGEGAEEVMQQIQHVTKVSADYDDDHVSYQVTFDWGVEPEDAKADVMRSLAGVESGFPRHWGRFNYWFEGGEGAMTIASVTSDKLSPQELSELLNDSLVPRLRGIEEFASVWIKRFDQKKIDIIFHPDRLTAAGVTPSQVATALQANEFNSALGAVEFKTGESRQVILAEKSRSLGDIKNTLIAKVGGRNIFLSDVADVKIDEILPDDFFKANGKNGLIIVGSTKPDANIAHASEEFFKTSKQVIKNLGIKADLDMVLDPAVFINHAVDDVVFAVEVGVVVAALVIFLFLGSLKNTIIIGFSIPFSLIGGFILMSALGIELNLISLGAMALSAGIVVDGSVVVIENITRHYELKPPSSFREELAMVTLATYEVANSVVASLLTHIIVFAPLSFTSPLAAAILGDLAKVIVCVSVVSMVATLVLTPPLVMLLGAGPSHHKVETTLQRWCTPVTSYIDRSKEYYLGLLSRLLQNLRAQRIFVTAVTACFILSLVVLGFFVKREIMGLPETDKIFLGIESKTGEMELRQSERVVDFYEASVRRQFGPYIDKTLSKITKRGGWIMVFLKDKSEIEEFRKKLEDTYKNTALLDFWVYPWTPTSLEIPEPALVSIDVISGTPNERLETLEKITNIVSRVEGVGETNLLPYPRKSDQFEIQFKENRLALNDIEGNSAVRSDAVLSHISQALRTIEVKEITIDDKTVPVELRFPEYYIQNSEDIKNLIIKQNDKFVPARQYVDVRPTRTRDRFAREDGHRIYRYEAWPTISRKDDASELTKDIKKKIAEDKTIDHQTIRYNDTSKEINENIISLLNSIFLALILIMIVICVQFASFTQTICIMLAIPLGIIGVAVSLVVFNSVLSVNSMLGIILLCGTAVNNSIIFVDFYNHIGKVHPELNTVQVIVEAARLRYRPIMITTLTCILGMIPIAVGFGEGGQILKPLGIAVCGGLWFSTILTLFIVPIALNSLSKMEWLKKFSATHSVAAVLAVIGLAMGSTPSEAQTLKLKDYEKAAVDRYATVQISKLETDAARAQFRSTFSNFLPKLDIGYQVDMLEQDPLYKDFDRRAEYSFLTVEYDLSSLFSRTASSQAAKLDYKKAEKSLEIALLEVQAEVRKTYYAVWQAQSLLHNAEETLVLAKRYVENSEKRYRTGLLHRSDFERSRLLKSRVEVEKANAEKGLLTQKEKLEYLTGLKWGGAPASEDFVSPTFSYFTKNMATVEKSILAAKTPQMEYWELAVGAAKSRQTGTFADSFMPHLYSQFSYRQSEKAQPAQDHTALSFGVKWNLFNGGKDYNSYKERVAERHITVAKQADALASRTKDVHTLIAELDYLQKAVQAQNAAVKSWKDIAATSQKRFESGVMKAHEVDEDFKSYLDALSLQFSLQLQTIDRLAELAVMSGDGGLFDQLM